MNSILFVLVKPPLADEHATTRWSTVTSDVEGNETSRQGVEILNRGTYLIHEVNGLPFLGLAMYQAGQRKLQYRVFFFENSAEMPAADSTA